MDGEFAQDTVSERVEVDVASGPSTPSSGITAPDLASLAPKYVESQHQSYLERLTAALDDERNRNIALTGRYGAGKSSILGKYVEEYSSTTLRLAISSLGPNDEGSSLTNRIQKEVVKQLVYSAEPSTLERSQFRRPVELSWGKATLQAGAVLAPLAVLLALMGWLPTPEVAKSANPLLQGLVWLVLAGIALAAGTGVRLLTHEKFFVSDLSAGGAKVKLSEKKLTYFDEYLDLIVNYFDSENIDVVIFEDLDRFDDPQIFEALRELNTLLNGPKRGKARSGRPLRFVYAVRDSLFEKIGAKQDRVSQTDAAATTADASMRATRRDDAATAETARANRTKFFEIVIPVVPFISHRNARDLLKGRLDDVGVSIERPLVDLVARHCTDMRLLRNMVNEYLVFAERLLHREKRAPELDETKLFALVAYKNFHMADFENIARRTSALDVLYDDRRGIIRLGVERLEREKRAVLKAGARPASVRPFIREMANRLNAVASMLRDEKGLTGHEVLYRVGDEDYSTPDAASAVFWDHALDTASITMIVRRRGLGDVTLASVHQEELESLYPELLEGRWEERNEKAAQAEAARLDTQIADLRGAGFRGVIESTGSYTMPQSLAGTGGPGTVAWQAAANGDTSTEAVTMADRVHELLESELARDLVRGGHIDLNYSVYAAQFYGSFAGIDVHTFLIQTEQTNGTDIDYKFDSPNAVQNLLAEASADFTASVSAFNTDVVDWLLDSDHGGADDVVEHLMRVHDTSDIARRFMATYLTSGKARTEFVARLAHEAWRPVFTHLVNSTDVPDDVRVELVDVALRVTTADTISAFDTPADVAHFVLSHYQQMLAYTDPQDAGIADAAAALLVRCDVRLSDLDGLHDDVLQRVVKTDLYELSAENLRLAASIEGPVALDPLLEAAPDTAYSYCLRNLHEYLALVAADDATDPAITHEATLVDVLNTDEAADWSSKQREALLSATAATATLSDLKAAPPATWKSLAGAHLFRATAANVEVYLDQVGSIDTELGELLTAAGAFTVDTSGLGSADKAEEDNEEETSPDVRKLAITILNARVAIPSTEMRAQLAKSLNPQAHLLATDIAAENSDLFARLLDARLLPDDTDTFDHLATGGWNAIRAGIEASENVATFLAPEHVADAVGDVLEDPRTADKVGHRILGNLDSFVSDENAYTWTQIAEYALRTHTVLTWSQLQRLAANSTIPAQQTMQLISIADPQPAEVPEVLAVVSHLESPWCYLATREAEKFDAPDDESAISVLQFLASQNVLKVNRPKLNGKRTVTLL
ncbi:hypothetical protein [Brachybacterium sp. ACRRE]|uniref:YobI family P-loop NTPase n=1 Tax=Brachybacterium sp. ACRRE TaxID=2918184 RepID=UPI001EF371E8|nr:hypothetical protein [Brachybacterium sp. ACRRE]MCG7308303.1 hypothetical protein [Brachybacterium sp. ACRRE]